MVTNLLPSTPGWKGLESKSLDPLAPQPLQLMLKTRLLISKIYLRCLDVLTSLKLGWLATSLRVMLLVGGRLLNKPREEKRMWQHFHGRTSVRFSFCNISLCLSSRSMRESITLFIRERMNSLRGNDGRSYNKQSGNSGQKSYQYNHSSRSLSHKGYTDYASSPPCDTCGKHHPGRACHRITGACFSYGLTSHIAKDYPKNGRSGSKGNGNDKQLAAMGKVLGGH
nr:zinc finger, CCHC-type, retrotransposon Gag domain protein [Tanacetum cinerariifolium]